MPRIEGLAQYNKLMKHNVREISIKDHAIGKI